jgi:SAM-dependent methyltransferase
MTAPDHAWKDRAYWDGILDQWASCPEQPWWRAHSDTVNRRLVREWLQPPTPGPLLKTDLFDEVAGRGVADLLGTGGSRVVGMDIAGRAVSLALERGAVHGGACADARALPFRDEAFRAVVSLSTLDHFNSRDEIRTSLLEIHRVLKPGGRLVITLDNPLNPLLFIRALLPFAPLKALGILPYRPGKSLFPGQFSALVQASGFRILERRAISHAPRVLAVKLLDRARRLNRPGSARGIRRLCLDAERLGRLPTRYLTGYFTAVNAVKP